MNNLRYSYHYLALCIFQPLGLLHLLLYQFVQHLSLYSYR